MILHPRRPQVESSRARRVLDWVDVCTYIYWTLFTAALAMVALIHGWDFIGKIRIPI